MDTKILSENNFRFNKQFGQNFIFDKNLLTAIVKDSNISKQDDVLEIGPGAGTLTKIIAEFSKKVVSYEIDKNLVPILEQNLQGVENSKVIFADALKTDIKEIENIVLLIKSATYDMFYCEKIATKAVPTAMERIKALQNLGFVATDKKIVGHDGTEYGDYFILEKD